MWVRSCTYHSGYKYRVISKSFIVMMTGGGITILDRQTQNVFKRHTGHKYLYTGDINPAETECFALENGKHFYVYSLKSFDLIKRITLPRCYDSVDLVGHYSKDGKYIYIPAHRWVGNQYTSEGYYEYVVFKYETENYTLVDKKVIDRQEYTEHKWRLNDFWEEPAEDKQGKADSDVDAIMKIIFGDNYKK